MNQPPREIPTQFETERLLLRAPQPGDGAAVLAAVLESLDELRPWLPWADPPPTPADEEAAMQRAHDAYVAGTDLMLLLVRKADGLLIGGSGLHRIDWSIPKFEIGYWLRTSASGHGYMTEAVNGITAWAFEVLGARRVAIHCNERNVRSAAVARRAGYTLEGVLRNHRRAELSGALANTMIFAQVRPDPLEAAAFVSPPAA